MPTPATTPAPEPSPEPELWPQVEAKRAVVYRLGPTGSSVRPPPVVARTGERVRTRLDAAFAYEMREGEPRVRVDVEDLVATLDDVEAWDAFEEQAEALAEQLAAMNEESAEWGGLAWIEHEALPDLPTRDGDAGMDVAYEGGGDVEATSVRTYRRSRSASGSCKGAGTPAPPTFN
jgi:hypothetical protein